MRLVVSELVSQLLALLVGQTLGAEGDSRKAATPNSTSRGELGRFSRRWIDSLAVGA